MCVCVCVRAFACMAVYVSVCIWLYMYVIMYVCNCNTASVCVVCVCECDTVRACVVSVTLCVNRTQYMQPRVCAHMWPYVCIYATMHASERLREWGTDTLTLHNNNPQGHSPPSPTPCSSRTWKLAVVCSISLGLGGVESGVAGGGGWVVGGGGGAGQGRGGGPASGAGRRHWQTGPWKWWASVHHTWKWSFVHFVNPWWDVWVTCLGTATVAALSYQCMRCCSVYLGVTVEMAPVFIYSQQPSLVL